MAKYILAHDIGTTGDKATVFDAQGNLLASAEASYPTHHAPGGIAEQNLGDWWGAVREATQKLTQTVNAADIACVSFSGQMMGLVCLDALGNPVRPSMIHSDTRATAQNARILEKISPLDFYRITGHIASANTALQKLLWLRENEPGSYAKTAVVLQAKDYIAYRLTGQIGSEYTDYAASNMLDINTRTWSERLLGIAELDKQKLPVLRKSTDIVGHVHEEAAAETGLRAGTPVVAGGADGNCAAVGCGTVAPGSTYNYIGSSSWMCSLSPRPIPDDSFIIECSLHPVDEFYHCGGTMQSAGGSYDWAAKALYGGKDHALIESELAETRPGAGGLLFLPYIQGERVPHWNPDARGVFLGLSNTTRRADMMRAVLEGVALNLRFTLRALRKNLPIDDIALLGGGASSPLWNQIMADVYNARVRVMENSSLATSWGAAIIGGVGAGLLPDFQVAQSAFRAARVCEPIAENVRVYDGLFPLFEQSYAATKEINEALVRRQNEPENGG